METYLTLLYVTLEQEAALKEFFIDKGWQYCKPDLGVFTDRVGPAEYPRGLKVRNGGIIMYSQLSRIKVENSTNGDKSQRPVKKVKDRGAIDDLDDGDNDDDFADDLGSSAVENAQCETEISNSSQTRGRKRAAESKKTTNTVVNRKRTNRVLENTLSVQEETSVNGSKKERTAIDTPDDIEAMMKAAQRGEIEPKPLMMVENKMTEPKRKKTASLKCSMCSKQYRLQYNLDKHYELAHDPDKPLKPKRVNKPTKRQCDICGSVFNRSDILAEHKRSVHEGIRKVVPPVISTCEICGSTFKRKDHLREHVLVKHSSGKLPYPCKLCEKTFIRPGQREIHMNRDHLNVKPYYCKDCNKKFFAEQSLRKHVKSKVCQPDRVKGLKCIKCEKTFEKSGNLEMHMTAVHFGGAYSCVCGEVVKWSGSVAKHKRKCKAYQDFVAINGEVKEKVCNVIEVPYSYVLLENQDGNDSTENTQFENMSEEDTEQGTSKDIELDTVQDTQEKFDQDIEEDVE